MTAPAILLLVIAATLGTFQSFRDAVLRSSIRMQDWQAYTHRVLEGTAIPVLPAQSQSISASATIQSVEVTIAAIALAWFALAPGLGPARRFIGRAHVFNLLRSLHSGVVGDYVMWIAMGVVALGLTLFYIPGSY